MRNLSRPMQTKLVVLFVSTVTFVAGIRSNPVVSRLGAIQITVGGAASAFAASPDTTLVDSEYPGTAYERMVAVRKRVSQLSKKELNGNWETVRRNLLWSGGLKDLRSAQPGQGYTGHSFNDFNHVDLTCMVDTVSENENDGSVKGIVVGNRLSDGIRIASLSELGPGGSWSTCAIGCNQSPPRDVAHVQFQSRIAFKLVWVPNRGYDTFVLVDDDGNELARGKPTGELPDLDQRKMNYEIIRDSKYSRIAEVIANA
eukprot:CAMPEP_0194409908 /NCGR_PEP_ID=MMETSP0176-20130528/7851_1 /TAXON_ID=216777 /ORGANISM="Proboscia alata, Strain PI-D3" /LENGTH=256 /DNA_ID=CAMNT_0039210839 /DNA_START=227 /DNA_END=997 /DNA_ORIENTATION=+